MKDTEGMSEVKRSRKGGRARGRGTGRRKRNGVNRLGWS